MSGEMSVRASVSHARGSGFNPIVFVCDHPHVGFNHFCTIWIRICPIRRGCPSALPAGRAYREVRQCVARRWRCRARCLYPTCWD